MVDEETTLMKRKKEEEIKSINTLNKDTEKCALKQKKNGILAFSWKQTPSENSLGQTENIIRPWRFYQKNGTIKKRLHWILTFDKFLFLLFYFQVVLIVQDFDLWILFSPGF